MVAREKAIFAQGLDHDKYTEGAVVDTVPVPDPAYLSREFVVVELPISAEVVGLAEPAEPAGEGVVDHCNEPMRHFSAS